MWVSGQARLPLNRQELSEDQKIHGPAKNTDESAIALRDPLCQHVTQRPHACCFLPLEKDLEIQRQKFEVDLKKGLAWCCELCHNVQRITVEALTIFP